MKNKNRKNLEDFLNGKITKLTTSSIPKAFIIIEPVSGKENYAQIFGWKETVEIPISEIDDYLAKIPKNQIGIILNTCRPITAEEIEVERAKNNG
ncbi:MAG: hypothetical protein ACOVOQ_14705 [Flavobacterium sp.]